MTNAIKALALLGYVLFTMYCFGNLDGRVLQLEDTCYAYTE